MAARRKGLILSALLLSVALLAVACSSSPGSGSSVLIVADDGLVLQGRFFGSGTPGVILVHDYGSDQGAWSTLAEALEARGYFVLTYDMRGHGASPGEKDVTQANADLMAVVRTVSGRLGRAQLFVVGEGLGGVLALNAASVEKTLGVVAVSAPTTLRGLGGLTAASRVAAPKLFVAAEGDPSGADSARQYLQSAAEPRELALYPGQLAGARLVKENLQARDRIVQFLNERKSG